MSAIAAIPTTWSAGPVYSVEIFDDWARARPFWEAAHREGVSTPFQCPLVMDAWYRAMADQNGIEPLIASVRDARSGDAVIQVALVRRRVGAVRVVGFADFDLVDFNSPIIGPSAPRERAGARVLLKALRAVLPPADVLDLRKMPLSVRGVPNPLALMTNLASRLNGNLVQVGDDLDAYRRETLKRVVRKELERCSRVFQRKPDTRFVAAQTLLERRAMLAAIERQQPIRMDIVGKQYHLGTKSAAEFYRRLVESDPGGSRSGLMALMCGNEVVAALMGLHGPSSFTMIRISNSADPVWQNCSPGRLVIMKAMEHLHAAGVRDFEFSVGNFDYKRRFAVEPTPLVDMVRALTPFGVPAMIEARGRSWLRTRPALEIRLRRLLGRAPVTETA